MPRRHDPLTEQVIAAAIEVHKALGPGLLESAYKACLAHELALRAIDFRQEQPLPVVYKECHLDCGYRLDFVVMQRLVIEAKAVEALHPIHEAQTITYLKLSGLHTALLINFNVRFLRDGIRRLVVGDGP